MSPVTTKIPPPLSKSFFSLEELESYFLGKGSERTCYQCPADPRFIIKISFFPQTKQTRREILYFQFLQKHKIPFTHLPLFVTSIRTKKYLGFVQQRILDKNGKPSISLHEMLQSSNASLSPTVIKGLLGDLFRYLYRYNILPCDLQPANILVQTSDSGTKLIMVDGLGNTDFIKIAQYFPWFGRRKIVRKMIFFLTKKPSLRKFFSSPEEIKQWVQNQVKAEKISRENT